MPPSTSLCFSARVLSDGCLVSATGTSGTIAFEVERSIPRWRVQTNDYACLIDCEDATTFANGTWHDVVITIADRGTHIFIDGYLAMCGTSTTSLQDIGADEWHFSDSGDLRTPLVVPSLLSEDSIATQAQAPRPLVEFAAERLSDFDAARLGDLYEGSVWVRFRTRGHGQTGTIFSAGGRPTAGTPGSPEDADPTTAAPSGSCAEERLSLRVDTEGITYAAQTKEGVWREFRIEGAWGEGDWHDLCAVVAHGAVDLYVDGFREAHLPGQIFFADTAGIDTVTIGQDVMGRRLFGEALSAAIYDYALSDAQVKKLSGVEPVVTVPVFDRGFHGGASYRIPSLLRLPSGVLIAGADQRTSIPNDSPNHIQFVVRRSLDNGLTWEPMQTVVESEGSGRSGASVIDSCSVYDRRSGRVVVLIDHYPGGIGQFNAVAGLGVDEEGTVLPYAIQPGDGVTADGSVTPELPTSYLCVLTSDDEGSTWSELRHINQQTKEEWMTFLGTGPGTGIQLERSRNAGRLVIPVYMSSQVGDGFAAGVVCSDDGGETWRRGESVMGIYPASGSTNDVDPADPATVPSAKKTDATYEASVVERGDGTLVIFMRNQHPSGRVAVAESTDGGESWGAVSYHADLPEIFSQPNAIPLSDGAICFANASQLLPFRGCGVLRLSFDGGATFPVSRTLNPGRHVYQSMAELADGTIGVLWENEWQGLYFTRVPRSWFNA